MFPNTSGLLKQGICVIVRCDAGGHGLPESGGVVDCSIGEDAGAGDAGGVVKADF